MSSLANASPAQEISSPRHTGQTFRHCLLVAGLTLIAILAPLPFANSSFDDDWSYSHAALTLARTGHFQYDGWMTSVGFFQTAYGALLISIFGFSFQLLRFATAPFAMGCAVLTYLLARKSGLRASSSVLVALTLTVSPYFIPLAASFMTDVYGCFFTLLCLYLGLSAISAESDGSTSLWLAAATLTGITGATTRQSVWPALIAVLACAVYFKRQSRRVMGMAAACAALSVGTAVGVQIWFSAQPNSTSASVAGGIVAKLTSDPLEPVILEMGFLLTAALFALPALICLWPQAYRLPNSKSLSILMMVIAFTALLAALGDRSAPVAPWIGNVVSKYGILATGTDLLGEKPVILPFLLRLILSAAVFFSLALCFTVSRTKPVRSPARVTLSLFALGYTALIGIRACSGAGFVFDRYAIPLVPVVLMLLLWRTSRVPFLAWVVLALFALFGIGSTHDYFAQLEARGRAESELRDAGVARLHWTAGLENDAWQELEMRGYVRQLASNAPAGNVPGDPVFLQTKTRGQELWWFTRHAHELDPEYFVVYAPIPGLINTNLKPVSFDTWLPLKRRQLWIQKLP